MIIQFRLQENTYECTLCGEILQIDKEKITDMVEDHALTHIQIDHEPETVRVDVIIGWFVPRKKLNDRTQTTPT